MGDATFVLTFATALGSGLAAGVFYAFSTYVMPGLRRLPAPQGIAAMQAINAAAPRAFMAAQFSAAVVAVAAAVAALLDWDAAYGWYVLAAAVVYVLSIVVLTAGYHIPRNKALDRLDPADPAAREPWARYLVEWTGMNHVRALAPLVASGLAIAALVAG